MRFVTPVALGLCLILLGADAPKDLHHNMEAMEQPFKQLYKQIKDPSQNSSSLELVMELQRLTLASKTQLPKKVTTMPSTQQAEASNDYRQMMVNLLRQELDLEEQLLNGDNAKAFETLEAMNQLQKDGHKEFRPKRKRN